ncbi:MAG: hypothetical protein JXB05_12765 [Myxococcaceae bacterium]|nr:hypothetical protein [Myxococcaceae bacterium]
MSARLTARTVRVLIGPERERHVTPREGQGRGYGFRSSGSITAHGDRVLVERTWPVEELSEENARNTEAISKRAAELARAHPEATAVLEAYVARQREECETLETRTVSALWLLERAPDRHR